jgi:hypothetical protein
MKDVHTPSKSGSVCHGSVSNVFTVHTMSCYTLHLLTYWCTFFTCHDPWGISAVSCVPISCVTENIPDSGVVPSLYLRRVPFRALVRWQCGIRSCTEYPPNIFNQKYYIGCFFKFQLVVGLEQSIVNAPLYMAPLVSNVRFKQLIRDS